MLYLANTRIRFKRRAETADSIANIDLGGERRLLGAVLCEEQERLLNAYLEKALGRVAALDSEVPTSRDTCRQCKLSGSGKFLLWLLSTVSALLGVVSA